MHCVSANDASSPAVRRLDTISRTMSWPLPINIWPSSPLRSKMQMILVTCDATKMRMLHHCSVPLSDLGRYNERAQSFSLPHHVSS